MRLAWQRIALLWLGLTVTFAVVSVMVAFWSAGSALQRSLGEQLPHRLADTLQYSFFTDADTIAHVSALLDEDLNTLSVTGEPAFLRDCHAGLMQLTSQSAALNPSAPGGILRATIEVPWDHGQYPAAAEFLFSCKINTPVAGATGALLALLITALLLLVPDSLAPPQRLVWFLRALKTGGCNAKGVRHAVAVALAPATIEFDFRTHSVTAHGWTVALPKTPYFYYAWYALQRQSGAHEGWLLNPATDRPDRELADSLIKLMAGNGGHQKAINDLREHGLRAKILDQNRNKVKEELVRVLGEELAGNFLFEARRDTRTARYRYRLLCPPAAIRIPHKPCVPAGDVSRASAKSL